MGIRSITFSLLSYENEKRKNSKKGSMITAFILFIKNEKMELTK